MKQLSIILFINIIILSFFNDPAFAQIGFELLISTDSHEKLFNAVEDSEGNFIMVGQKEYEESEDRNAYLVKVSSCGELLYEMEYSFNDSVSYFDDIYYSNDSIIIFGGKGPKSLGLPNALWVVILDEDLNLLKSISHDLSGYRIFDICTILNSDDNYVICGMVMLPSEDLEFLFYELTSSGDSLNRVIPQMIGTQIVFDIMENSSNDGYKVFVTGTFTGAPIGSGKIAYVDKSFNIITVDTIPYGLFHQNNARRLTDTSYIVTGIKAIQNPPHDEIGIAKLNSFDSIMSINHFGMVGDTINYPGAQYNLDFISQDNIYYGGYSNFHPGQWPWHNDPTWILLTNLDQDLNLNWEKYYGGDAFYQLWGLKATSDGGCLLLSTRYDHLVQYHEYDIYILKVDSNGLMTSTSENSPIDLAKLKVFPNPASNTIIIRYNDLREEPEELIILNSYGIQVKSIKVSDRQSECTLDVSSYPTGLYIAVLKDERKIIAKGKFIVTR